MATITFTPTAPAAPASPPGGAAATAPTRADAATNASNPAADFDAVIDRLGSDDPKVRRSAGLRLNSLGGDALAAVERAAAENAGNPEVAGRLRQALPILRARAARDRRTAPLAAFQRAEFAAAYRDGAGTDPRWDADALAALAKAHELRGNDAAARGPVLAAFGQVVQRGCRSPLVLTAYRFVLGPDFDLAAGNLDGRDFGEAWRDAVLAKGHPAVRVYLCARTARAGQPFLAGCERALATAWADLVADPAAPPGYADEVALDLLDASRDPRGAGVFAFNSYDEAYRKTADPTRFGHRLLQGNREYDRAWALRGSGGRGNLTPEQAKSFADHLALAATELEAAWKLDPGDARAPCLMVAVQTGLGNDPAAMEAWFRRAVAADPDLLATYRNKLLFVGPIWYGSPEAAVEFGRECARTENWRAGVPFILVDAHEQLARDLEDRKAYFAKPEVWQDVRAAYEGHLVNFPADAVRRSEFARYSTLAEQWREANEQFEVLGDKADPTPFGGKQTLDYLRRKAAKLAEAGKGTAGATRPAVAE